MQDQHKFGDQGSDQSPEDLNVDLDQVDSPSSTGANNGDLAQVAEPQFYAENEEELEPETFDLENIDMDEQKRLYEALQQSKNQRHYENHEPSHDREDHDMEEKPFDQPEMVGDGLMRYPSDDMVVQPEIDANAHPEIAYEPEPNEEDQMLVNEDIEELQNNLEDSEPIEKPQIQPLQYSQQTFVNLPLKEYASLTPEQAYERLLELGEMISTAIKSKQEPVKDFEEINTLFEKHFSSVNQKLLELGVCNIKKMEADPEFELSPEQLEEQKQIRESAEKEHQQKIAQRDAFIRAVFTEPAYWVLEEKIIMKFEYMLEIFRFFKNLLVFFFPDLLELQGFCQIINDIFDQNASLYGAINYLKHRKPGMAVQPLNDTEVKKREMINKLNELTEQCQKSRVNSEKEWREGLKVGDYLDALNYYSTQHNINDVSQIMAWCPAKVMAIQGNIVQVAFLGMPDRFQNQIRLDSIEIAPQGTFTDNFNVRFKLQPGDLFDCCDDYGIWYKSTVKRILQSDEVDVEGKPVLKVHVAFRFPDPEGQKTDEQGNRFTGFLADKFDMFLYLSSPCVKPLNSMSYQYNSVQTQLMKYELEFLDDIKDIILNNKHLTTWTTTRKGQFGNIHCFSLFLNQFGERQGFEKIIQFFEKVKRGEASALYTHINYLQTFLARTMPLWTREFVCFYTPRAAQAYIDVVTSTRPDSPLSNQFQKEQLTQIVDNFSKILRRYYVPYKYQSMVNYLNTSIGSTLLASNNLEKRIQGVKMMTDQIREVRMSSQDSQSTKLVQDLINLNVLENIFASGKFHLQICQRASEVLRIYSQEHKLTEQQMEMLLDASAKDEASKIEIFKMFSDCSQHLEDNLIVKLIQRLEKAEPSSYQIRDIDLVHNLARSSYKGADAKECAINLLYSIAVSLKPGASQQLLRPARKHLIDLLKSQSRELKEDYICRCIDRISDQKISSVQSIKILMSLIKTMPKFNYLSNGSQPTQKEFVKDLVEHQNLITNVITDLAAYKQKLITYLREETEAKEKKGMKRVASATSARSFNLESARYSAQEQSAVDVDFETILKEKELFEEGFTHQQNMKARLKVVLFALESCEGTQKLQKDQIDLLWDILMTGMTLQSDQELFFKFLRLVLSEKNWMDIQLINEFFENKIENNPQLLSNIQIETFNCIQSVFLIINENKNFLNIISKPKEDAKSFSAKVQTQHSIYTNSPQAGKEDDANKQRIKLEFRVHLPPQQLKGIGVIWEMFRKTNRSQTLDLQANIIFFLALVYQSCSRLLWSRRKEIYEQFTHECLQNIHSIVSDPKQHQSVKEELVKNTMYMLKEFFQASEKRGTACIRPHSSLEQQLQVYKGILLTCMNTSGSAPKHLLVTVDSQMTVWELLDIVAQKQNRSPLKIKLHRNSNKPEITQFDNCKSLAELKFEDFEEINVIKQPELTGKVPLINPQTSQLVREVEEIFGQWFNRFSLAADQFNPEDFPSNDEPRYMTKLTCVEFLTHTVAELNNIQNERQIHNFEENKSINELFSAYDSDQDGRLTKSDFIRFYTDKSNSAPDKVWQNLIQHEIGRDLHPCPKREVTYDTDVNVVRDQTELPRYLISSNLQQLEFLFNLETSIGLDSQSAKAKDAIWKLVTSLKTNPQLYLSLLRNVKVEETLLAEGHYMPIHKLLYMLQIIQSFVIAYSKFGQDTSRQAKIRSYFEGSKIKPKLNDSENFPTVDEAVGKKKFGNLQMQNQGQHKGDNAPPLDTIEESRENATAEKQKKKALEGDHWHKPNVNILPNGENPIALPAGEAQESIKVTGTSGDTFKYESSQKESYYRQQVNQWKGEMREDTIESDIFSNQELIEIIIAEQNNQDQIMEDHQEQKIKETQYAEVMIGLEEIKRNWIIQFIKNKGFQVLVQIMTSIVQKYANCEAKDSLTSTAEVEVLKIVTYMIRVILISCFCSQTQDQDLATNLQRKLSSTMDEEMAEKKIESNSNGEKENQHATKQAVITQQFKELIQLLSEDEETSKKLIASIDFQQFQNMLSLTFEIILRKQHSATNQEKAIVAECLNIFISCISFNSDLLQRVYSDPNQTAIFCRIFIDQGLLGESIILRTQFKDALLFISYNVRQGGLPEAPALFFLRQLLSKVGIIKQFKSRSTPQFFQLLSKLTNYYFMMEKSMPVVFKKLIEPADFTKSVLESLFQYESEEQKNSNFTDFTLVGLLKLAKNMLVSKPGLLSSIECGKTLNMLVQKCLFNQQTDAQKVHIRKDIDIKKLSQKDINKCHTIKSREAAYSLMDAIIKTNSDPNIVETLFENFWAPFITQLKLQKEGNNYAPDEQNRASCGFCGLRNLGCICYMNAVLQQMFNVPAFRYSLLAASDMQPKNLVEHEGRIIDDNLLHQWMRMFAFLSMSDRKEYNPMDFCFAYKQNGGIPTNVRVQMDAQEFINVGFERLENALKPTAQKYLLQNVFQGQTASLTICRECGNINQNDEDFYCLPLNVKNMKNLYNSLESMVTGEIIEDFMCNSCNKKVEIEKKTAILNLPNTMIVHLNRITFDMESMRNIKINDKLEFPNVLNVKKYMVEEVHREQRRKLRQKLIEERKKNMQQDVEEDQEPKLKKEDSKVQEDEKNEINENKEDEQMNEELNENIEEEDDGDRKMSNEDCEYKLVGVVIHMGMAEAGHYLSYINIERENNSCDYKEWLQTNKQNWMEFNDSTVSSFDFSKVQYKCYGEEASSNYAGNSMSAYDNFGNNTAQQSHNAYMLIYEKAIKLPLKIVCDTDLIKRIQELPDQIVGQLQSHGSLVCDGTATARLNAQDTNQDLSDVTLANNQSIVDDVTQMSLNSSPCIDPVKQSNFEWLPHSFLIYPQILSKIHRNEDIMYDEKTKEFFVTVPFNQVEKFVPSDYYSDVHLDNQLFLAEKQVFCNPFFKTTASLLEQIIKQTDQCQDFDLQQQRLISVYQILDKLIFEMIIRGSEQKHLKEITQLLFMVIDRSERALHLLINDRILAGTKEEDQKTDKSKEKPFFDMLIFHREQEVREIVQQILSKATKYFYDLLEEPSTYASEESLKAVNEPLEKILNTIISMIPGECMKAWHKLGAFFDFFYELVKDGNAKALNSLVERKLISKFVNLVTKFKDQQAYEVQIPPFDKLVLTIASIVRSQPLIIYLPGIDEANQPTADDVIEEVTKLQCVSPFYKECSQEQMKTERVFLKGEDLRSIMLVDKKPKEFFSLALKYTQESKEIAQMIGHLCWNNYAFSRRVGKTILQGLNNVTEIELQPFLGCLSVYLSLDDQFQTQRIEWLMGIPDFKLHRSDDMHLINDPRFVIQKIGLQRIKDVEDNLYEYKSTLFKEPNAYRETLLHIMYSYRKDKFQRAMLLITDTIFDAMVNQDKHKLILKYLLSCEPPSYTCQRYFDWFEPHFINYIQKCSENLTNHAAQEEFEISLRIHANIEKLKQQNAAIFSLEKDLNIDLNGRLLPDPYLVWNITKEQVLAKITNDDATVHAVLHQLTVGVTKSRPTGSYNDSLTRIVRGNSYMFKQRKPQINSTDVETKKQWENQVAPEKTQTQRSKPVNKHDMRGKRAMARADRRQQMKNDEDADGDDDDIEDENQGNVFITSDDKENIVKQPDDEQINTVTKPVWQEKLNNMEEDMEFDRENYINPNSLDFGNRDVVRGTLSQPENEIPWPSVQGGEPEANSQEATGGAPKMDHGDSEEYYKAEEEEIEQEEPHELEKDSLVGDELVELDCVLVLVVRNFNKYQAKHIRVEYPPELRSQMNWFMPTTEMCFYVAKTTDKTCFTFQKKSLLKDWGPIDQFRLVVENLAIDETPCNIYEQDYPELRQKKKLLQEEIAQQAAQQAVEPGANSVIPDEITPAVNMSSNEKECGVCTYINYKSAKKCEVCESPF